MRTASKSGQQLARIVTIFLSSNFGRRNDFYYTFLYSFFHQLIFTKVLLSASSLAGKGSQSAETCKTCTKTSPNNKHELLARNVYTADSTPIYEKIPVRYNSCHLHLLYILAKLAFVTVESSSALLTSNPGTRC